ncbi:hypothetical protein F4820DRAFT_467718 [Hypoxylon rubiginosum]|uniref:Uncharacterized protein n=1 Tax=Hypoxylon rubiginosum TaxID=110542 RepID=A0ACB9Z8Q0_9PEZI|nr:hypothetical protein F4820DRAFT_467718 [Hypoxylon rubiginosum]
MCFTEFVGYTCGHASTPVKRLCPLTTQLYNNPCCAQNAVRPVLSQTFCPTCARILHGRWVNILELEHRFMHERGVCGCAAQFPHLQQPRVVSHYVDTGSSGSNSGSEEQRIYVGDAANHHYGNGHDSEALTQMAAHQSHLSGSAAPFVPSHNQAHGLSYGGGAQDAPWGHRSSLSFDATAAFVQLPIQNASAAGSTMTTDASTSPTDQSGSAKSKGKGKQQRNKKAQDQAAEQQQQQVFHQQQQQQQEHGYPTAAFQTATQLAPLFEERQDSASKKPMVSVRMLSLYGAEWLQDHEPLHADGRCSCQIRFERYESPPTPVLGEASPESGLGLTDVNTLAEYNAQYLGHHTSADISGPATTAEHSSGMALGAEDAAQGEPQQNPLASSIPHVTTNPGHPARWACSPDSGIAATAAATPSAPYADHPVDMQTAWYEHTEVPLAGLPIGAGPEGDSHMPPFEECELHYPLHYPKLPSHRRSASH